MEVLSNLKMQNSRTRSTNSPHVFSHWNEVVRQYSLLREQLSFLTPNSCYGAKVGSPSSDAFSEKEHGNSKEKDKVLDSNHFPKRLFFNSCQKHLLLGGRLGSVLHF